MTGKIGSVLFVCALNSIRSPMAEGLMKKKIGHDIYVQSCGLEAGGRNELMVAVMREKGIDLSRHNSKTLSDLQDSNFDLVISFDSQTFEAAKAVFADNECEIECWEIPDPTKGSMDVRAMMNNFRAVRDNIEMRIEQILKRAGGSKTD